ncbi:glycosyltransferase family 32 protein [Dichomitus squalens]|uniref:Glycosyltransferase family 32 protein n=2 Tax=Dichomitus squalens TaxID=114155 RepID=A0A4Q9N191_9APHY|nr:glycosyltransferase family 32 protein [Dichomitus squalens LYAD-421 SS1]EJF59748.1 glycosyltransferase family 32 protein [Dichomitus squalens LYAD-421 SS1]TBU34240.1 glycosyltransferase family 32 protein [Dichomitus squalens]TBU39991.1 glycosyltransferase family 32 protein [Dichomitus squalens]TBU53356.1 glycosyltransferase family 32 protein [Dichomitus squalens]
MDYTVRQLLRPQRVLAFLKIAVPVLVFFAIVGLLYWEPHVEIAVYNRSWVKQEILTVPPLGGCFSPSAVSPSYNLTDALYGPRRTEVHAGTTLQFGMDCYEFAGTVQPLHRSSPPRPIPGDQRIQYHTYWRTDLAPFGPRQEWMLKSFFATQDTDRTRLILWSNGDLAHNPILQKWLARYPDAFALKVVDYAHLARGTELEGSPLLQVNDKRAWIDGDLVRLLVIWAYGGVWIDMDSLLTRDLAPLLEHEFVTQWDCYDKKYVPMNGALMHFRKHSPYLCEAFHVMVTSDPPRKGTTDWGALLYFKLRRRLLAGGIPPFKVLPFCFSDARSCRLDNRLPDPFASDPRDGRWTMGYGREEGGGLDNVLGKVFSVHLHNQWKKPFPPRGWVERLLLRKYDQELGSA